MKVSEKIEKYITDPNYRFKVNCSRRLYGFLSDEAFVKKAYYRSINKPLNLEAPSLFTEKLQWLKLYDHKPIYTVMVDKAAAKDFARDRIGEEYIIPTIEVFDSPGEMDFGRFPEKFVLKCTHNSGLGMYICTDRSSLDVEMVKQELDKGLRENYYAYLREWPYKNVTPRIIAEQYLVDEEDGELRDYKFFTFGGNPKLLYVTQGRGGGKETYADFFDMDFNHIDMRIDHDNAPVPPHKPKNFELMKELAAKLSEGTPQLRVDFYEANGRVYFGELTFFHCSGLVGFDPPEWDEILGSWVELPEKQV